MKGAGWSGRLAGRVRGLQLQGDDEPDAGELTRQYGTAAAAVTADDGTAAATVTADDGQMTAR